MIMLPWNKKQSVPITPLKWRKFLGKQWCIEANYKQNIENNQRILTQSVSDKNKATDKITLVSDNESFPDDLEIAEKFNEFY